MPECLIQECIPGWEESCDSTDTEDLALRVEVERVVPSPRSPRRSADDMEGTVDRSADTAEPE
jgi:hypothetical protein